MLTNAIILQSGSTLVSIPGTMDGLQLGRCIGASAHSYLQGRAFYAFFIRKLFNERVRALFFCIAKPLFVNTTSQIGQAEMQQA